VKSLGTTLLALILVAVIGGLYEAYKNYRKQEGQGEDAAFQLVPGSYSDGHFVWSKEGIVNGKPTTIVTIEFQCKTARFRNIAIKTAKPDGKWGDVSEFPDSPWVIIQPDTFEAKVLEAGCRR